MLGQFAGESRRQAIAIRTLLGMGLVIFNYCLYPNVHADMTKKLDPPSLERHFGTIGTTTGLTCAQSLLGKKTTT